MKQIRLNSDYLVTYTLSIATIFTNLAVAAIFARFFAPEVFLEFNVLTRYFGFFIALGSGSVGYALIYYLRKDYQLPTLYGNAVLINLVLVGVVASLAIAFGSDFNLYTEDQVLWFLCALLWVLAQSIFHTVISLYRGLKRFGAANMLTLAVKVALLLTASAYCALAGNSIFQYYGLIGLGSIAVLTGFVYRLDISVLPRASYRIARQILAFSLSRWGDSILRIGFSVFMVFVVSIEGNAEMAGYVAILLVPLKGIESSLQPIVMVVFSKWVGKSGKLNRKNIMVIAQISIGACLLVFIALSLFGEFLVAVWITEQYSFLAGYLVILSISIFPLISIALLRGVMEGEFKYSPSLFVNGAVLLIPALFFWYPISLDSVVWAMVGASFSRFVLLGYVYRGKFKSLSTAV